MKIIFQTFFGASDRRTANNRCGYSRENASTRTIIANINENKMWYEKVSPELRAPVEWLFILSWRKKCRRQCEFLWFNRAILFLNTLCNWFWRKTKTNDRRMNEENDEKPKIKISREWENEKQNQLTSVPRAINSANWLCIDRWDVDGSQVNHDKVFQSLFELWYQSISLFYFTFHTITIKMTSFLCDVSLFLLFFFFYRWGKSVSQMKYLELFKVRAARMRYFLSAFIVSTLNWKNQLCKTAVCCRWLTSNELNEQKWNRWERSIDERSEREKGKEL